MRIDGGTLMADGFTGRLALALPGRANRANAMMAWAAAVRLGAAPGPALTAMATTTEVVGRYRTVRVGDTDARLLLSKNPAGWLEVLDVLAPPPGPVVVAINARIADGRDPSWLWDVPFERLAGRSVVASGERSADLAVRLHYAGGRASADPRPGRGRPAGRARAARRGGQLHGFPDPAHRIAVSSASTITVALLFPDLLGTYGDSGNATILAQRLRWRGHPADVVTVRSGDPVPEQADVYVVGGGEDLPQSLAARQLGRPGPLHRAVDGGAAVLAVCAGLQILGTSFVGPDGVEADGLGLVDCRTVRGVGLRAVGELVVDPGADSGLPALTGYENHGGVTTLGPEARPMGRVRSGVGNGDGSGTDGITAGHVVGTYLHGPVLARNPALADLLLSWVVGDLAALDDTDSEALRNERLAAADSETPARERVTGPLSRGGPPRRGGPPPAEAVVNPSTALFTDRYELTMLDGALGSGVVDHPATFEVFARRLPSDRTHGVFGGLGRLLGRSGRLPVRR